MLRLQNIQFLDVSIIKQSEKFWAAITNYRYYASRDKDDFKSLVVPIETNESWKKIQIMAKEHQGELKNDSVNEVLTIAKKYRYRPKESIRSWKKRMLVPTVYTVNEKVQSNMGTKKSPFQRGKSFGSRLTDKRSNTEGTYSSTHRNQEDNDDEYERDDMGRYISKSEMMYDMEKKKRKEERYGKKKNAKSDEMLDGEINHQNLKKTFQNKKYNNYNQSNNNNNNKIHDNHTNDNSNTTEDNHRLSTGTEHSYYKEFMKLIIKQRQPPFIYSSVHGRHNPEIDVFLKELTLKLKNRRSFSGLGIEGHLVELLASNNITTPTQVQVETIPELLRGRNAIIESSTGSGKTLAFLLPMIQNLSAHSCSNIIVAPTRELATQIYREIILYGKDKYLVSRHVSGAEGHDIELPNALKNSKILVGTPKKLVEVVEANPGYFRQVRCIVIDEVDKLLPVHPRKQTKKLSKIRAAEKLLAMMRHYRKSVQMVATSATISDTLVEELRDMGFGHKSEHIKLIPKDYKYGKIPENIKHLFTVVTEADGFSKVQVIRHLFEQSREKSILVFIHRDKSVDTYVDEFKTAGLVVRALFKELLLPAPSAYGNFLKQFESGDVQVVVSTEETVRGIDFPFLNHVYLTFVPDTPERYVHLAGRVGRLGKPAQVLTLIGADDAKAEKKHFKRRLFLLGVKGRNLKLSI